MLKHFIKIAYRNLLRRKAYSIINITGLAVGISCCLLITYYVQHELSYDRYHKNGDRIYRVTQTFRTHQKDEVPPPPTPEDYQVWGCAPLGPALKADFPAIEKVVQFTSPLDLLLQTGNTRIQQDNILCMDSTAFEVFSWKMLAGNPHTALVAPNCIVLTKSIAEKFFGNTDPVGKSLVVNNGESFLVTGVMEDVPSNSHFDFSALVSMTTFRKWREEIFNWWGYVDFYTYFLLKENSDISSITANIPGFLKRHNADAGYTIAFEKLHDAYLYSSAGRQPGPTGSPTNIYIFALIALFILVIACINFMNLSTARSMERAKEVGVRKVLGAVQGGLVRQFLSESVILSLIAATIAVVLAHFALPLVGELSGKDFTQSNLFSWQMLLWIALFTVITGLFAGLYPAWFLARFKTMLVLKGVFQTSGKGIALRKVLVIFQFTISMALIAGTGIIFSQLQHLRSHELGFRKDQMMIIDFGGDWDVQKKIEVVKRALLDHPAVVSATASRAVPGEFLPNAYTEIQSADGQMKSNAPLLYEIDFDFISTFEIPIIAGRGYSRDFPADSNQSMVINEAAARQFGYTNPADAVGKKFSQWGRQGTIIGVLKDFNFRSLHLPVEPLTLRYGYPGETNRISLVVKSENLPRTISDLKTIWDKVAPQRPFLYSFLDDSFNRQYEADAYFGRVFSFFAGFAIFIACLGLFGLATFTAEQRTKEIGIRKVLGSSVAGIVTLISKDFLRLVIIAIVVAVPVTWWAMNKWLDDFAYRVHIGPGIFLLSALVAIVVALITISWQSVKAALANPVNSLRNE
ncbi:MAG: ABC transporter permease [Chitinophagaceae bacterium]|nr:ABC transporter permease [Chitinophagaceae bacterium]